MREPLVNLSSAFKNWTSYNNSKSFSFKQLCYYYDRIRNGIDYCQKYKKNNFYIIRLEDIHHKSELVLKNFCKLFNLEFQITLYSSTYHNKQWWGDSLSKKYLNGINKNYSSQVDESLFYDHDIKYLKSSMREIYSYYDGFDFREKIFFSTDLLKWK